MSTARNGTRKIRPDGAPKLGETYRDWRDFTDRVARPWLDNDGADPKVDAWYRTLMVEADPWYLACALVLADNRIRELQTPSIEADLAWWQEHAATLANDFDRLRAEVDRLSEAHRPPSVADGTVSQSLIDRLQHLIDEFGYAGVDRTLSEMGAVPEGRPLTPKDQGKTMSARDDYPMPPNDAPIQDRLAFMFEQRPRMLHEIEQLRSGMAAARLGLFGDDHG